MPKSYSFGDAERNNQVNNFNLPIKFEDKQKIIADENLDILFYPEIGLSLDLYYLSFVRLTISSNLVYTSIYWI